MEISALTRSVVKQNHAIIAPDGYINSNVPGWSNCTVNVIINEGMGAGLCQTLITANQDCTIKGRTLASQIFFYIVEGSCTANVNGTEKGLKTGQFVYVPIEKDYSFTDVETGTKILTFHKVYEMLDGYDVPEVTFGEKDDSKAPVYMNDEALRIQELLPNNNSWDMAVNIFTYQSGGHLPMVETHIMEHGLLYLQGQGVYMLDQCWYPVKKGDSIWMAPYCQQWFTAMGKEPAVYIYYKNVNRFPTII